MSPSDQLLNGLNENELFQDTALAFDLKEGVIWNPAKTRLCLISTDLLTGVYRGMVEEAGPAWRLVFKSCGVVWGRRVATRLDRECAAVLGKTMAEMPLEAFLNFVAEYFAFHGWGRVTLDTSSALSKGLVGAELRDSIFAKIVDDREEMADPMIAGILESLVSHMSGTPLTCVQTACLTKGAPSSRFLIGAPARLESAEAEIKLGKRHEELLESL